MPHRRTLYKKILAELTGPMQLSVFKQELYDEVNTGFLRSNLYVRPRDHSTLFGQKVRAEAIVEHLKKHLEIEPHYQTSKEICYARNRDGKILRKGDVPDAVERVFVLYRPN